MQLAAMVGIAPLLEGVVALDLEPVPGGAFAAGLLGVVMLVARRGRLREVPLIALVAAGAGWRSSSSTGTPAIC